MSSVNSRKARLIARGFSDLSLASFANDVWKYNMSTIVVSDSFNDYGV